MTDIVEIMEAQESSPMSINGRALAEIVRLRTALAAAEERAEKAEGEVECVACLFSDKLVLADARTEAAESLVARFVEACGPFVRLEWPDFGVKDSDVAVVRAGELRLEDFRALASLTDEAKGE